MSKKEWTKDDYRDKLNEERQKRRNLEALLDRWEENFKRISAAHAKATDSWVATLDKLEAVQRACKCKH